MREAELREEINALHQRLVAEEFGIIRQLRTTEGEEAYKAARDRLLYKIAKRRGQLAVNVSVEDPEAPEGFG